MHDFPGVLAHQFTEKKTRDPKNPAGFAQDTTKFKRKVLQSGQLACLWMNRSVNMGVSEDAQKWVVYQGDSS